MMRQWRDDPVRRREVEPYITIALGLVLTIAFALFWMTKFEFEGIPTLFGILLCAAVCSLATWWERPKPW